MIKLTVSLLLVLACFTPGFSQQARVKGIITDTAEQKTLANSVIALLKAEDSTLVKFTRSNKSGAFELSRLPAGNFLVLVIHPGFADYYYPAPLTDTSNIDLATVPMILRSQLLEQFVVTQKIGAVRLKKDTTEYIADSFKVDANANVEELLKRMPGIQVGADGKIKTQGEEVQKVLVDGEEFFGDDPTMATKNLRADAIDRVQVFDKKSDQAAFTGIDDGVRTKTINLKLKEDKKNGYFGKLSLGGGLKDKFNNEGMINAFKGKRKFAAYGTMSNTGRNGLNWGDRGTYGGAENQMEFMEDGGGIMIMGGGGDDFGGATYYGEGLPTSWTAGVHFSNKYKEDKYRLNTNYRFNKLNAIGSGSTITQYLLGSDSSYYRNENGGNFSQRLRNSLGGIFETQLDSTSSLKFTADGYKGRSITENYTATETLGGDKAMVNNSRRNSNSKVNDESLSSSLLWRKRMGKPGRTLSVNLNQKYTNKKSDGFLNTFTEELKPVLRKDTVDQEKQNNTKQLAVSGKASYTEPLSNSLTMEVNYSLGISNNESERGTYNKDGSGKYSDYVDSLSSHYRVNVLNNSAGLNLRYNRKKINLSVGGNITHSEFNQKDIREDTSLNYHYLNLFPRASLTYAIKPQSRIGIRYNGSTRQPSIDQLQPLNDNTDYYYERKGNPELKQEFRHNISVNFNDFKVLNNRYMYGYLDFTTTTDAISTRDELLEGGKRISQPYNVSGNYSYNSYFSFGTKLKGSDFNIGFGAEAGGGNNNSLISVENLVQNQKIGTRNGRYGLDINGNYRKDKKIEFGISFNIGYNTSRSTQIGSSAKANVQENNYFTGGVDGNFRIYLPFQMDISGNGRASIRQKTDLFPNNQNVYLLNGSFNKKIFKDKSGIISFEMRDVLNQNIGFSRDIEQNYIQQRTYETIRRFWLLSFTWNFSKNGAAPKSQFEFN